MLIVRFSKSKFCHRKPITNSAPGSKKYREQRKPVPINIRIGNKLNKGFLLLLCQRIAFGLLPIMGFFISAITPSVGLLLIYPSLTASVNTGCRIVLIISMLLGLKPFSLIRLL